jgi:hypothetical protein
MSSYDAERQIGYNLGYEAGVEAGKKEFREFDDKEKTVFYHVTKILSYLGVENPKIANAYKAYLIGEAEANA